MAKQDSASTNYSMEEDLISKYSEDSFDDFGSSDSWTFESNAQVEPEQAIDDVYEKFLGITDDISEARFVI